MLINLDFVLSVPCYLNFRVSFITFHAMLMFWFLVGGGSVVRASVWLADFLCLPCDPFMVKVFAVGQPTRQTQPSIPSGR